jgi:aryl-alcohol dehydrogenase-like predicted oxidoreductase
MERRRIGKSAIEVAPLALGGNVFGWTADEATSMSVLDAFVDAGGTMIDTADVYSAWVEGHRGGESETVIGRWLKRDPSKRDRVVIATKVGMADGLAPEAIAKSCDQSLQRLGVDRIDLYYQHKDDEKVPLADSLGAFERLVEEGKIGSIGLSNFTPARIDEALEVARSHGFTLPVALQPKYNLLDREFEQELRAAAVRVSLGVIPYYGLASGFLTGKYRSREDLTKSARGSGLASRLNPRGMVVLDALDEISNETGAALATIALSWLMAQPTVAAALASATSLDQLAELTAAMSLRLTPEQIDRLDRSGASGANS